MKNKHYAGNKLLTSVQALRRLVHEGKRKRCVKSLLLSWLARVKMVPVAFEAAVSWRKINTIFRAKSVYLPLLSADIHVRA